jgi:hypothetical protein
MDREYLFIEAKKRLEFFPDKTSIERACQAKREASLIKRSMSLPLRQHRRGMDAKDNRPTRSVAIVVHQWHGYP